MSEEAITPDDYLSQEDQIARVKGLALASRFGQLYQTDAGFRAWYHEGLDEITAGRFVVFSEDGWSCEGE
jgi:hypothetical protein